jgi:hypothetical protein
LRELWKFKQPDIAFGEGPVIVGSRHEPVEHCCESAVISCEIVQFPERENPDLEYRD